MKTLKTVFVHDHVFYVDNNGQYFSQGGLPKTVWDRYLKHFKSVTVVGRKSPSSMDNVMSGYALSSREDVNFVLMPNLSGIKAVVKNRKDARNKLKALISSHDSVIARLTSELGLLAIEEAKRQNKPWAVELVDCPWDALINYGSFKAKLYAPLLAWRVKRALASSSYALYVTQDFLQLRYPAPKAITTNCSNVQIPLLDENTLTKRIARIETANTRSTIIFGLLGSLHGRFKGIQTALAALARVKDILPPLEFRILGGGDPSPWQNLANQYGLSDNVFFDGTLPSGEPVFEWLDNIDIYLHPSLKEGLPRALIEAMSRGCPAIASNVAGTPELLDSDFLINPSDVESLAEKIVNLSSSRQTQMFAARTNFNTATRYSQANLDEKRFLFWKCFSEHCLNSSTSHDN